MLMYKNYIGHVQFDDEAEIFHGEVINTKDVITFQGRTVKELKKAFKESIDDYIDFCAKRHESPDKPFSGKFNLRLNPELHREIFISAKEEGMSLNQWVVEAVSHHLHEKHVALPNWSRQRVKMQSLYAHSEQRQKRWIVN